MKDERLALRRPCPASSTSGLIVSPRGPHGGPLRKEMERSGGRKRGREGDAVQRDGQQVTLLLSCVISLFLPLFDPPRCPCRSAASACANRPDLQLQLQPPPRSDTSHTQRAHTRKAEETPCPTVRRGERVSVCVTSLLRRLFSSLFAALLVDRSDAVVACTCTPLLSSAPISTDSTNAEQVPHVEGAPLPSVSEVAASAVPAEADGSAAVAGSTVDAAEPGAQAQTEEGGRWAHGHKTDCATRVHSTHAPAY